MTESSAPLLPTTPETLGFLAPTSPRFPVFSAQICPSLHHTLAISGEWGVQFQALEPTPEDWCGDIRLPDAQSRKLAYRGRLCPRV